MFHMPPAACLMWPQFVVMPDLKLLSAFHCQMPPNVWVVMAAPLQLAALQRVLRFNAGSCDYSGRVWKGSASFIARLWKCFLCHTIRTRWTRGLQVLLIQTQTNTAGWHPRRRAFEVECRTTKVTIGVKPNHFVTLCQKFGLELIKKKAIPQFHLPFILAGLINVSLFHNTISTGLLNLIALLHSLILFLPSFHASASLTRLHAATRYILLSESGPSCTWSLCSLDPRPCYTFSSGNGSENGFLCAHVRSANAERDIYQNQVEGIHHNCLIPPF